MHYQTSTQDSSKSYSTSCLSSPTDTKLWPPCSRNPKDRPVMGAEWLRYLMWYTRKKSSDEKERNEQGAIICFLKEIRNSDTTVRRLLRIRIFTYTLHCTTVSAVTSTEITPLGQNDGDNLPADVGPGHSRRIRRRRSTGGAGDDGAASEAVVALAVVVESLVRLQHQTIERDVVT